MPRPALILGGTGTMMASASCCTAQLATVFVVVCYWSWKFTWGSRTEFWIRPLSCQSFFGESELLDILRKFLTAKAGRLFTMLLHFTHDRIFQKSKCSVDKVRLSPYPYYYIRGIALTKMNHKYTMEINEKEIILTPEKHNFTLIWIHGLNESPQAHLRYILTKPLLEVTGSLNLGTLWCEGSITSSTKEECHCPGQQWNAKLVRHQIPQRKELPCGLWWSLQQKRSRRQLSKVLKSANLATFSR